MFKAPLTGILFTLEIPYRRDLERGSSSKPLSRP
ncbi:MAG: hypothetical protein ABWK01_05085 [Infirmifilum sp.]